MDLPGLLILCLAALLGGLLAPVRWRSQLLAAISLGTLYWLQPASAIRNLDFWLPTLTIGLVILTWVVTRDHEVYPPRRALLQIGFLLCAPLLIGSLRYFGPFCCLTPTRPPQIYLVATGVLIIAILAAAFTRLPRSGKLPAMLILSLVAFFLILKSEPLAGQASIYLRRLVGQDTSLATALDLRWLGYSYLAFRLIAVLRDFQSGKQQDSSLGEFTTYVLFFPALLSGPIDRLPRFLADLRKPTAELALQSRSRREQLSAGAGRLFLGVFKKFALADTLAIFALSTQNAPQVESAWWGWVFLYTYALRIYLDFSGYTDIAIGLGQLLGVRLPENFSAPYTRTNLTSFWNAWHITLAQWFRAYTFNPLTRFLRSAPRPLPVPIVVLIGQLSTMLLIGLWHGVTWNFAIWGAWHGIGLYIHNRWSDWLRPRLANYNFSPLQQRALAFASWVLTFHWITLGWVWFALPTPGIAWEMLARLFGLAG